MRNSLNYLFFICYFLLSSEICVGQETPALPTSYPNGSSSTSSNPYSQKHYADLKKAEIAKERERAQKDFEEKIAKLDAEVVKIGNVRQLAQLETLNNKLLKLKADFQTAKAKIELDFNKAENELEKEKLKILQNSDN